MAASILLRLARRLHAAASLPEVMDQVVEAVCEATRYQRAWLILPMQEGYGIEVVGYCQADRQRVNQRMESLDWRKDKLALLELSTEKTLVIPDLRLCPEADQVQVEYFGNRTIVAVSMLHLGKRLGSLNVGTFASEGVMPPTQEEIDFVEETAALVSVVAGRLRAEESQRVLEASVQREQRLEALGRMAGEVAHDFNNILVSIIGNAEFLLSGSADGEGAREALTEVLDAGNRAAGLTRQLLAFSRGQPVERREVKLRDTLTAITPMLRRLLPSSITLEVAEREAPGAVLANAGQLELVLMNLVLNARDAIAEAGRITITLDTRTREGARWAVISVQDTGSGMPQEIVARIFEPFFTTKGEGKGTGLGLAVAGGVVRSHGGSIEVASEPGQGTLFTVLLPELSRTGPKPQVVQSTERPHHGTEHVLVVDDNAGVRVLLERVLSTAGYRVTLAEDGMQAMERLVEHPDTRLVITDLVMPRLGGDELVRRLSGRLRVLLISGYASHPVVLDPGTSVLAKPFSSKELLERVREVLDAPLSAASTVAAATRAASG